MGSKSKRIGKDFEYEIRDLLREATGLNFERVPTSGAWIGGANAVKAENLRKDATEIMAGDIICPEGYRWCIECKNEADVPVHLLFLGSKCEKINDFLEQISSSAKVAKKEPLLFMKYRKSGYKLPRRILDVLTEADVAAPKTNSITLGTLVAEKAEYSEDISSISHIFYNNNGESWRFFDIVSWLKHINTRQYTKNNIDN